LPAARRKLACLVVLLTMLALAAPSAAQQPPPPNAPEFPQPVAPSLLDEAVATDNDLPFLTEPLAAWGRWQGRAGVLLLNRTSPSSVDLSWRVYHAGRDATDFNFPLAASPDISLRRPGAGFDLDFRYFGVLNSTAQWAPQTTESSVYAYGLPPILLTSTGALNSTLQSAELNLRWLVGPNISQLIGFRYVQFRERMSIAAQTDVGSSETVRAYDVSGRNEMFGVQIGNELRLLQYRNRLQLLADVKVGLFGNAASSSQFESYHSSSSSSWDYGWFSVANRGGVAFVGDINLTATYQILEHVALRGGYQLLILVGTATAADQLRDSFASFGTYSAGTVVYHGAMAGLEWAW